MNVGGILKSGATKLATGAKSVAKSIASKAPKNASNPEMLTRASEALSRQGKASINIGKNIGKGVKGVTNTTSKNVREIASKL